MAYHDWHEPVRLLVESNGPATQEQHGLARLLSLPLGATEPRKIASARLEDRVEPAIHGRIVSEATERQIAFLQEVSPADANHAVMSKRVASAWIDYYLAQRTVAALKRLQPRRGDQLVMLNEDPLENRRCYTVSSVGANGRIYFMGGGGAGAWPSRLQSELSKN